MSIHPETFMVTADHGPRPAGELTECFYCHQPIGSEHKSDCVLRQKTVLIQATIRMVVAVPEDWNGDNIEFKYNEGSWCSSNIISDLQQFEDNKNNSGCLCPWVRVGYMREATEDEEAEWGLTDLTEMG